MILPTRDQIRSLSDLEGLQALADEIERHSLKMETDLEFSDKDDEWAARARAALSLYRFHHRLVVRQIKRVASDERRVARADRAGPRERLFITGAEALLHPSEVQAIWAWVNERQAREEAAA